MKHIAAAVLAACVTMLITSGLVAFATAAPEPDPAPALEIESVREVESALLAQVDTRIEAQLAAVRTRLGR